jgi:hypothetical protein
MAGTPSNDTRAPRDQGAAAALSQERDGHPELRRAEQVYQRDIQDNREKLYKQPGYAM